MKRDPYILCPRIIIQTMRKTINSVGNGNSGVKLAAKVLNKTRKFCRNVIIVVYVLVIAGLPEKRVGQDVAQKRSIGGVI